MESNDRLEDLLRQMYAEEADISDIVDEEWQKFEARNFPPRQRSWGWMQIAATIISVLMLSGITYAAINHLISTDQKPGIAVTDRKPDVKKVKKTYGQKAAPANQDPVVYNNVELRQIMQYIADGYGVKVVFKNEKAGSLRFFLQWEADDTLLQIIDKINHFEKVHLTLSEETITIE